MEDVGGTASVRWLEATTGIIHDVTLTEWHAPAGKFKRAVSRCGLIPPFGHPWTMREVNCEPCQLEGDKAHHVEAAERIIIDARSKVGAR